MRSWICLGLASAVLIGGRAPGVAAAAEPQEMIRDGGFENGESGGVGTSWASESWGNNHVQFDLSTDKAQFGKYSQHVRVEGYKDGMAQVRELGMHVSKGQPYTITVWMRGSLSVPVTFGFRKYGPPYTCYLKQEVRVSPAWQRFTISGTASDADENAGLYLFFSGDGDLWIDSISARPGAGPQAVPAHSASP